MSNEVLFQSSGKQRFAAAQAGTVVAPVDGGDVPFPLASGATVDALTVELENEGVKTGEPLSSAARSNFPLNIVTDTPDAAHFAVPPILPANNNVPNPALRTQALGKGRTPTQSAANVPGASSFRGPVTVLDAENPVRIRPSALFKNVDSELTNGLNSPMPDGPAVRTPGMFIVVGDPALAPWVPR